MDTLKLQANNLVIKMVGSENMAELWWGVPSTYFNGMTPNRIWEINTDLVFDYLLNYEKSVPISDK